LRDRGHIVEVDEPPWGRITHHGLPGIPSLSKARADGPAPWIGDHTRFILKEILGMNGEDIQKLDDAGALK